MRQAGGLALALVGAMHADVVAIGMGGAPGEGTPGDLRVSSLIRAGHPAGSHHNRYLWAGTLG